MEVEFMPQFTEHTSRDRAQNIIKGKRTKRQRPCSGNTTPEDYCLIDNSTPDRCQSMVMSSDDEDEDMANCLILLARSASPINEHKFTQIRQKTEKMITSTTDVYECKTCNRTFPSFQALGGHRASHKKLKLNVEDKKSSSMNNPSDEDHDQQKTVTVTEDKENTLHIIYNNNDEKFPLPTISYGQIGNNKIKVHECSICGSEFSSGQALGGHMRKHRPVPVSVNRVTEKSPGSSTSCGLSLDLNFPPPDVVDDVVQSKFQLGSPQQHLVFSAPALVGCHY